jgi:hypothetical protein
MDLNKHVRWIATWSGRIPSLRAAIRPNLAPAGECEWDATYELIMALAKVVPGHCGCSVIGTDTEWLFTTFEYGSPSLTASVDRTIGSFEDWIRGCTDGAEQGELHLEV